MRCPLNLLLTVALLVLLVCRTALPAAAVPQEALPPKLEKLLDQIPRYYPDSSSEAASDKFAKSLIALKKYCLKHDDPDRVLKLAEKLCPEPRDWCGNANLERYMEYVSIAQALIKRDEYELANVFFKAGSYAFGTPDDEWPPKLATDGCNEREGELPSFSCIREPDISKANKIRRPYDLHMAFGPHFLSAQLGLRTLGSSPAVRSLHIAGYDGNWITEQTISLLPEFPNIEQLGVCNVGEGSKKTGLLRLNQFSRFKTLQRLHLGSITDDSCKRWTKVPDLNELTINDERITDWGISLLPRIETLKKLDLRGTGVTQQVTAFLDRFPNLEEFEIYPLCDDASMRNLVSLRNLRVLSCGNKLSDAGLAELPKFENLRKLTITSPHVTAAGLRSVCKLSNLHELALSGDQINDAAIACIAASPTLKSLQIYNCPITFKIARVCKKFLSYQ